MCEILPPGMMVENFGLSESESEPYFDFRAFLYTFFCFADALPCLPVGFLLE